MNEKPAILYVDDEDTNLFLFRITFAETMEVLLANSPKEGLAKLDENKDRIEAVISDMNMPEMNGVEFIQEARRKFADKDYFILSGYSYSDQIDKALKENIIKKFFPKPFSKTDIEKSLKESFEDRDNKHK